MSYWHEKIVLLSRVVTKTGRWNLFLVVGVARRIGVGPVEALIDFRLEHTADLAAT